MNMQFWLAANPQYPNPDDINTVGPRPPGTLRLAYPGMVEVMNCTDLSCTL